MEEQKRQGRTNYDWVNGMRVGIIAGGVVGLVIGLVVGWAPFVIMLIGGAAGGVLGAQMAQRW